MKTNDELFSDDGENDGLPSQDELTPLSQSLISPELASAFSISPSLLSESPLAIADGGSAPKSLGASPTILCGASPPTFGPASETDEELRISVASCSRSERDGLQADQEVDIGNCRHIESSVAPNLNVKDHRERFQVQDFHMHESSSPSSMHGIASTSAHRVSVSAISQMSNKMPSFAASSYDHRLENGVEPAAACLAGIADSGRDGGAVAATRTPRIGESDESDAAVPGLEIFNEEQAARTLKRPRLVWTPQLHKRFVDAVAHLGIKTAVPKTIMQLMNVDGLTRENVASHLQKYRLYLKRMQGLSTEGPSSSDHLFASTSVPPNLVASAQYLAPQHRDDSIPLPFVAAVGPVTTPGLGLHAQISNSLFNTACHFGAFDQHGVNFFSGLPTQRLTSRDQSELQAEDTYDRQSNSPPRHILTLFPTSSC